MFKSDGAAAIIRGWDGDIRRYLKLEGGPSQAEHRDS